MPSAKRRTPVSPAPTHAFKGLDDWIEVFRAGTHVDSKGRECSFSDADLAQMAANVALGKPPAVLGHPKDNDPAYAWGDLKAEAGSLYAKFEDINPAFAAGVESGAYRNRSVSIIKDKQHGWRVRHVGWLGAAPPAIDGLKPVQFAAEEADEHEFSADDFAAGWALGDVASLMRGLRDWLISKDGLETADRVLPAWSIDSLATAATRMREQAAAETNPTYTAPTGDPTMITQEQLDAAVAAARAEEKAAQAAEFTAAQDRLQALETERRNERIQAQVQGLLASGHITPAEATGLPEFLAAVDGSAEFEFAAADKSQAKKTPAVWFAEFVASRKPVVALGQRLGDPDPKGDGALNTNDAQAIAAAAREFQAAEAAAGRHISVDVAVTRVMQQQATKA